MERLAQRRLRDPEPCRQARPRSGGGRRSGGSVCSIASVRCSIGLEGPGRPDRFHRRSERSRPWRQSLAGSAVERFDSKTETLFHSGMTEVSAVEEGLERVIGVDVEPDRPTGSTTTRSSPSTDRLSFSGRTTSGRSSTTGRGGSARTRSSASRSDPGRRGARPGGEGLDLLELLGLAAIGLLRGLPPATILQWWRGHPPAGGNPEEVNVASICVPIATVRPARGRASAWGMRLKGSDAVAVTLFGDGATSEGAFHEGEHRRRHEGAARPALQQQPVGDLHTAQRPDRCRASLTRRSATACPPVSTGTTCSRCTKR